MIFEAHDSLKILSAQRTSQDFVSTKRLKVYIFNVLPRLALVDRSQKKSKLCGTFLHHSPSILTLVVCRWRPLVISARGPHLAECAEEFRLERRV
jgi:hypothetical protein